MADQKKYFVTAIGTNIGKTVVSSVLVNALKADYWKPVQCGIEEFTDSDFIRATTNANVFPEKFLLAAPVSPHQAAKLENLEINPDDFALPGTKGNLIVEGAGGMMVPLNDKNDLVIDLAEKLNLPVIIISSFYLGSINHTLLSLQYAKQAKLKVAMLIFNGEINESSLQAIRSFYPQLKIGFVPHIEKVSKEKMQELGEEFMQKYGYELE